MNHGILSHFDELVAAKKEVLGRVDWTEEQRPSGTLIFTALLAINGDTSDGLTLRGRAAASGLHGWISLVMTADKVPVERVWYLPHGSHTNKAPAWAPVEIHRLFLPRLMSRRYAWADNRVYPHEKFQEMARLIPQNLMDASAAISYALTSMNIRGVVPDPKFQPTFGL